jgi:hypothetical protein
VALTPTGSRPRSRRAVGRARLAVLAAGLALLAGVLIALLSGGGPPPLPLPGLGRPARASDPFAYIPARAAAFANRAIAGEAHVLFVKGPGGVVATAARVSALHRQVEAAAAGSDIVPATLEGIVFLESAGDPNAIAGGDPANAAGLTQIVASTGTALLGMHIDLSASRGLTARINHAAAAGNPGAVARLEAARAKVDPRFDPRQALAATVRYLRLAERNFGRTDLAVASYHMGIGNLTSVLRAYDGGQAVPYVKLFFDTAPDHNAKAYALLSSFGDDSWTYLWRVLAAEQIMRLYRSDPAALTRLAALQSATGSAAYVLHPPDRIQPFADPDALDRSYAQRLILPLPRNASALGLAYGPEMGALAPRLGVPRALYRGLRAPALDLLIELAGRVRALSGGRSPLTLTSTVLDQRYAGRLGINDPVASAGWTFTVARRYVSPAQALAFQSMLDRLQALNLIAWQRYPSVIEVTVAADAGRVIASGP